MGWSTGVGAQAVRLSVLSALLQLLEQAPEPLLAAVPALLAELTREQPELQKRALDGGALPHLAAILELPNTSRLRQVPPPPSSPALPGLLG